MARRSYGAPLTLESVLGLDRYAAVRSVFTRLLDRIECQDDGHWAWRGSCASDGTGHVSAAGATRGVARIVYVLAERDLPPRTRLERTCSRAGCISPAHHRLVPMGARPPGERLRRNALAPYVEEIRRRRAAGESIVALAEEFHVSRLAIRYVVQGRSYPPADGPRSARGDFSGHRAVAEA